MEDLKSKAKEQNSKIKMLRYSCKKIKTQNRRLSSSVMKHRSCVKELKKNLTDIENTNKSKTDEIEQLKSELDKIQNLYNDALKQSNEHAQFINNLKTNLNESLQTSDYLHSLIQDNKEIEIWDEKLRAYTPEFRQTVMNISGKNVATEHIASVINESLKLAVKTLKQIPVRRTIDNYLTEKVVVSYIQVGQCLKDKQKTTLYSDETRKFGKTYNSYFISDHNKNAYILGLREMHNKTSTTTLDTFKEILTDISELCNRSLENCEISYGYNILCNIKDFMSDRAKTNIAFTDLLIDYRKQIMPQVVDG